MLFEYFSIARHRLYLVHKYTGRLRAAMIFAIPAFIYVRCLKNKVPPTVENTEIIQTSNTSINNFKFIIWCCARRKGIWQRY